MAIEPNNTALEFETMLRRHLSRGGGPVSVCVSFDADAANSYLESALGGAALARYEAHLAGCPACRRHVIELSRLSQMMPRAHTQASTIAAKAGRWAQWKSSVVNTFNHRLDFSAWRWNWSLAGTAAAACVVLATAMIVQPWRQSSSRDSMQSAASASNVSVALSPTPAPSFESPPDGNPAVTDSPVQPTDRNQQQPGVPRPKVQVTPGSDALGADQMLSKIQGDALSRQLGREVAPALQSSPSPTASGAAQPRAPSPPAISQRMNANLVAGIAEQHNANKSIAAPQQGTAQFPFPEPIIALRITPKPEYNPMQSVSGDEQRKSRSRNDKSLSAAKGTGWTERVMGYMPLRKEEIAAKSSAVIKDDETVSSLVRKVRDKTFIYQKRSGGGVWVDQAYKPELMYWRVTQIARGGKEYERLLAEEPQLKEFFSLGKIIIVWGDKVYRVIGQ